MVSEKKDKNLAKEESMKKVAFVVVLIALLAVPMASYAQSCEERCEKDCRSDCGPNDSCYWPCVKECRDRCKNKRSEINTQKLYAKNNEVVSKDQSCAANDFMAKNIVLASGRDDNDQPCIVGGKYVGNCSLNKPYYNAFSGECYATLSSCGGSSSCVRCGN
jgi:hypothetical protein